MSKELSELKKQLIPWIRHWDMLDDSDEPQPLPDGVIANLIDLASNNPTNESILRELLTVHLLLGNRAAAIRLLKQILALPGKRKPKQILQDRNQLANLQKGGSEPQDVLLKLIGVSRSDFIELGLFLESKSEESGEISLSKYPLCYEWFMKQYNGNEDGWEMFCKRLAEAAVFGDFGVREAYFEFTPGAPGAPGS